MKSRLLIVVFKSYLICPRLYLHFLSLETYIPLTQTLLFQTLFSTSMKRAILCPLLYARLPPHQTPLPPLIPTLSLHLSVLSLDTTSFHETSTDISGLNQVLCWLGLGQPQITPKLEIANYYCFNFF